MEEQAIDLPPRPQTFRGADAPSALVVSAQEAEEWVRAAVLAERERCANLCNDYSRYLLNLADGAGEHCETEAHAAEACFHLIMGRNEYGDDPGSEHFGDSFAAIRST